MIKNEWKSLLKNRILVVVVLAIIIIPVIYAGLFLKSMWDPYGNVDKLPVAVVNHDQPVVYNGKDLNVGKDMEEALSENDSLDFHFVDSDEAEQGLRDGTYYMVITIPENFSANASTLMDDHPQKMELKYETNPGTNYIASKMSETAVTKIRDEVASQVTETYTQAVFDQIAAAGDGMQDAADGAGELKSGIKTASDGNKTITENLMETLSDRMSFFRLDGMCCAAIIDPSCTEDKKNLIEQIREIITRWYRIMGISVPHPCSFALMEYPLSHLMPADFAEELVSFIRIAKHDPS